MSRKGIQDSKEREKGVKSFAKCTHTHTQRSTQGESKWMWLTIHAKGGMGLIHAYFIYSAATCIMILLFILEYKCHSCHLLNTPSQVNW